MRRILLWLVAIVVLALGLAVGRNYQLDSAAAALKLGRGDTAVAKLKPMAVLGDRNAQVLLGYTYAYGWAGVAPSDEEAMRWFSHKGLFGSWPPDIAAGKPGASEALSVARAYATGSDGVHPNPLKSKKWLQIAAHAGNGEAAADLARTQ